MQKIITVGHVSPGALAVKKDIPSGPEVRRFWKNIKSLFDKCLFEYISNIGPVH